MTRIAQTFARLAQDKRKALIPFFTAGDPKPDSTVAIMHAAVRAGADVIELGVPFSDPQADGPAIQRSSERALAHHVSLKSVLEFVREFRRSDQTTPVVLMGYANPIEQMGIEVFARAAQSAGVDGVLVVDYPPEECADFASAMRAHAIDPIFLLSPTSSPERIEKVITLASGYIYYVSLRGVTGAAHLDLSEVEAKIRSIRRQTTLPIGVGFGIREPVQAKAISAIADAAVIGSRVVTEIETASAADAPARVESLLASFRKAMDQ